MLPTYRLVLAKSHTCFIVIAETIGKVQKAGKWFILGVV